MMVHSEPCGNRMFVLLFVHDEVMKGRRMINVIEERHAVEMLRSTNY